MQTTIVDPQNSLAANVTPSANGKGLLNTLSISIEIIEQAVADGVAYLVSTGKIVLSTANESAVFYISNKHADDCLNISLLNVQIGISDSPGPLDVKLRKNSKTGTIVTNAVAADIIENKNFNRTNVLSTTFADVFKGAEGDTVNGDDFELFLGTDGEDVIKATGSIVLEPGNSVAITITPPAGNTGMTIIAGIELFIINA